VVGGQRPQREPDPPRVALLDRGVGAARADDHPQVLVVEDRQLRAHPAHQPQQRPRLGLGGRARSGVVGAVRPGPPAEREVAVEIDAVRVLPGPGRDAVGIGRPDQPQPHAVRARAGEPGDDALPRALVAVDVADDQHPDLGGRIAHAGRHDRPVLD
jgi:hypothetical protein